MNILSGWLIEKYIDGVPHWWVRSNGNNGDWDDPRRWTINSIKAARYDYKLSAEYVMGRQMTGCTTTYHEWVGP